MIFSGTDDPGLLVVFQDRSRFYAKSHGLKRTISYESFARVQRRWEYYAGNDFLNIRSMSIERLAAAWHSALRLLAVELCASDCLTYEPADLTIEPTGRALSFIDHPSTATGLQFVRDLYMDILFSPGPTTIFPQQLSLIPAGVLANAINEVRGNSGAARDFVTLLSLPKWQPD